MLPLLYRLARLPCSLQFLLLSLCSFFFSAFFVYSFLLPSSLDLLPLSAGIPSLCVIITITLHREVATCFLTNWVSILFEWSLFLLLQDFPWNWFLHQLIGHAGSQALFALAYFLVESGHPSDCFSAVDLGPPDPTVSVHITQVSSMTFTCAMRAVFSLTHWTRVTHCMELGGTWSNVLTAWGHSDILPVLVRGLPSDGIGDFRTVLWFSLWPSARGFPSLRGTPCDMWLEIFRI